MTTPAGEPSTVVAAAPPGPGDGPQYFSHRQILVVLVGVMAGMLLFALDQGIVGTALPRIVSKLGGLDKLSWVVTAYLLTSTATTVLWGKISDLYGRRLIFQVAIGLFLLGSALSGLSQNMGQLIAFRALQGVGGGGDRQLARMKPTAILVNVARAGIIDERALYEHLRASPDSSAGIDTWWHEPPLGEKLHVDYPFFDLPNVVGSPHNSSIVAGSHTFAASTPPRTCADTSRAGPWPGGSGARTTSPPDRPDPRRPELRRARVVHAG